MQQTIAKHRILFLVAVFVLLPATVFAAAAAIDSFIATDSGGNDLFQVDLYEIDESNLPAVTYKYAVTDLYPGGNALSHWTLGIEQCTHKLVSPTGNTYTTPIDPAVCGEGKDYPNCVSATYGIETGSDPTTGVDGIKFEDDSLAYGETHLFYITVGAETGRGDIEVAVKPGNTNYTGMITGPICRPTAVTMGAPSVATSNNASFFAVAAAMMFMGVISVGVLRKK